MPTIRHPPESDRQVTLPFEFVAANFERYAACRLCMPLASCRRPPTNTSGDVATCEVSAIVVATNVKLTFVAFVNPLTVQPKDVVVHTTFPLASFTKYPVK